MVFFQRAKDLNEGVVASIHIGGSEKSDADIPLAGIRELVPKSLRYGTIAWDSTAAQTGIVAAIESSCCASGSKTSATRDDSAVPVNRPLGNKTPADLLSGRNSTIHRKRSLESRRRTGAIYSSGHWISWSGVPALTETVMPSSSKYPAKCSDTRWT